MWGPITRLRRWLAPRPKTGYVVTLLAETGPEAGLEIDVGVRTPSPETARDRALHFAETLMPDLSFRPVAMWDAEDRDLVTGEIVAQIGPIRHQGLPSPSGMVP